MIKATSLKTFFFPDDTKIKVECTTDVAYNAETGKLTIHRKFYTMRSLATFAFWYFVKNPIAQAKEIFKERPAYGLQYVTAFALFFLAAFDLKNVQHFTLFAGAIAFDAASSTSNTSTTLTFAHTISGANNVLVVKTKDQNASIIGATYNAVSMSVATGSGSDITYYLSNPTAGANNIVVTRGSGGNDFFAGAISLTGANTSNPIGNVASSNTAAGTAVSTTMTTAYDNSIIVENARYDGGSTIAASGTGHTKRWGAINNVGGLEIGSTKTTTTAGSNTLNWDITPSGQVNFKGVEIREFVAGSLPTMVKANQAVKRASFW